MEEKRISRTCGTHDGTFHADEVTACALLLLFDLIDKKKIIRSRDLSILNTCEYVCDVGGVYDPEQKKFDHHQATYQGTLSSAGMVLKYLKKEKYLQNKEYSFFKASLIIGVDAHDNGKDPMIPGYCSFSHIISNFNPVHYDSSPEEQDAAFFQALDFTLSYLKRLKEKFQYAHSCREIVAKCMKTSQKYLLFEQNLPWMESFFELGGNNHQALFVVMPSGKHWKLRGIPPSSQQKMKVRHPLPKEWAGLLEKDLQQVSKIPGAIFCHKGRFISVWKTKEDAFEALKVMHLL